MAPIVGTVKSASGPVGVKKSDGELIPLNVGDTIEENDVVQTLRSDSSLVLELEGGRELTLGGNEEVLMDQSVFGDVEDLQAALRAGLDPSDLEATAAGEELLGDSVAAAPMTERGDARGSVEASLRPTESAPGETGPGTEGLAAAEEEEPVNTPPVAEDDAGGVEGGK